MKKHSKSEIQKPKTVKYKKDIYPEMTQGRKGREEREDKIISEMNIQIWDAQRDKTGNIIESAMKRNKNAKRIKTKYKRAKKSEIQIGSYRI